MADVRVFLGHIGLVVETRVVVAFEDLHVVLCVCLIGLDLAIEVGLEGNHVDDGIVRRLRRHGPYLVVRAMKRPTLPIQQVLGSVQPVSALDSGLGQRLGSTEGGVAGLALPASPDMLTEFPDQLCPAVFVCPLFSRGEACIFQ
jgi:hypothetical protein